MAFRNWILEANLSAFCGLLANRVGYSFDDGDEIAITHGLAGTDLEVDRWFEYPLVGDNQEVTLRVARDPGSSIVNIHIEPDGDTAYREGLVDVMQLYVVTRDHG